MTLNQYAQLESSLSEELEHGRQRSKEVEEELGAVLEELGHARLDHHETWRQQQRKEVLGNLLRLYPDTVVRRERPFNLYYESNNMLHIIRGICSSI